MNQEDKENLFSKKFELLCTKTLSQEIHWTSSDSEDLNSSVFTVTTRNKTTKPIAKTKRPKKRRKPNLSNLEISFSEHFSERPKSPVILGKHAEANCKSLEYTSCVNDNRSSNIENAKITDIKITSPILKTKVSQVKEASCDKVRRRLYDNVNICIGAKSKKLPNSCNPHSTAVEFDKISNMKNEEFVDGRSSPILNYDNQQNIKSPILGQKKLKTSRLNRCNANNSRYLRKSQVPKSNGQTGKDETPKSPILNYNTKTEKHIDKSNCNNNSTKDVILNLKHSLMAVQKNENMSKFGNENSRVSNDSEDKTGKEEPSEIKTKPQSPKISNLVQKVKSFFDAQFSSENNTQDSIQESQSTSKSHKSDTISIIDLESIQLTKSYSDVIILESAEESVSLKKENSNLTIKSLEEVTPSKVKKKKFKKGGLAQRLCNLTLKQNSAVSLWKHELYLAETSNFIIPNNDQFRLFRIKKITYDFGTTLIEAMSLDNDNNYYIVLNNHFTKNIIINDHSVLKLYEPYFELDVRINDNQLIINACKFQFIDVIKKEDSY